MASLAAQAYNRNQGDPATDRPLTSDASAIARPLTISTGHRTLLAAYIPPLALSATVTSAPSSPQKEPATSQLPHLTLTYAQSLDAQISLGPALQTVLSGWETKGMTHYLRTVHDAILVGVGTAEVDDPGLSSRFEEESASQPGEFTTVGLERQPIPVILDPTSRWAGWASSKVVTLALEGRGRKPLWVVDEGFSSPRRYQGLGKYVEYVPVKGLAIRDRARKKTVGVDWELLLQRLREWGIDSVMVEGGGRVIVDLLREENQRLVGSVIVTVAPVWLGSGGVSVIPERNDESKQSGRMVNVKWVSMGEDVVMCGRFGRGG